MNKINLTEANKSQLSVDESYGRLGEKSPISPTSPIYHMQTLKSQRSNIDISPSKSAIRMESQCEFPLQKQKTFED